MREIEITEKETPEWFWKELAEAQKPHTQLDKSEGEVWRPTKKILIVDDEPTTVFLLKVRLAQSDYEIDAVENGEAAYNKIKAEHPDLIILDVMLPGMGGFEICTKIRDDKRCHNIPIVILSARAGDIDQKMGFDCGGDAYFGKPCDIKALIKKVARLLES